MEAAAEPVVVTTGLIKRYGPVAALDGLDLAVAPGTVHGLLGPNGAGKTTAVRILATLTRPDSGEARIGGIDVRRDPLAVRRQIGLAGQFAAVDEILTGRQNLEMFGRLFHLGAAGARTRGRQLLEQFDLVDAADKGVKSYSGGMRRRLDLAASMILAPRVLFLDEPTTGLDPRGRNEVWESLRALVRQGTTVLLTTQYLDEADQLADRVTVIDHGRAIADGTPSELKAQIGDERIDVVGVPGTDVSALAECFAGVTTGPPTVDAEKLLVSAPVDDRVAALTVITGRLQAAGLGLADLTLRRPTLDDVFLQLTGRPAERPVTQDEPDHDTGAQTRTAQGARS